MANPTFLPEELVLILDHYLKRKSGGAPPISVLSAQLRSLQLHEGMADDATFRNVDGVGRAVRRFGGFDGTAPRERRTPSYQEVWEVFAFDSDACARAVTEILSGVNLDASARRTRQAVARDFDPAVRPNDPQWRKGAVGDSPESRQRLQEKASVGHHLLLCRMYERLLGAGWSRPTEMPRAIDLAATDQHQRRFIFEAKTITPANEARQARSGLAQLIEYRCAYGSSSDALVLLTSQPLALARCGALTDVGIASVVSFGDKSWAAGNALGQSFLERTGRDPHQALPGQRSTTARKGSPAR